MRVELQGDFSALHEKVRSMLRKKAISLLRAVGEQCVNEAVANGSYHDNTGNLRSSIGYAICENGTVINWGGFHQVKEGTEGPREGKRLAYSLATETTEMSLFVVAGMSYASIVADKGYNVLDSAEILAQRIIEQLR